VTGGHCKLQWKVDWAMRWLALDVDYEMSGKDLIDSVRISSAITRKFGNVPPQTLIYELFLDERGEKISKSKGNGLTVEEWIRYGPEESLSYFMYLKPGTAKRLYFDVIPKSVDEYFEHAARIAQQDPAARLENPVWHVHAGAPPRVGSQLSFGMLLNLVSVCHTDEKSVLWNYITKCDAESAHDETAWDRLLDHALSYYRDFVKPKLRYRAPNDHERAALQELRKALRETDPHNRGPEAIQALVYEIGKRHEKAFSLRGWFQCLYQVLLGQDTGPRMGSFIALYGVDDTIALIDDALARTERADATAEPLATD
jgi:lysyl-tRNA synthetase class 1